MNNESVERLILINLRGNIITQTKSQKRRLAATKVAAAAVRVEAPAGAPVPLKANVAVATTFPSAVPPIFRVANRLPVVEVV